MNWLRVAVIVLIGWLLAGQGAILPVPAPQQPPTKTFTPTALYFLSPTGNDACNGTSPASGSSGNCAWATPNHAVNCGDVILAAPGTYASLQFVGTFSQPSTCPSTTGGIDGTGGIYYAIVLCTGDLAPPPGSTSCIIRGSGDQNGGFSVEFDHTQSNWAFEGFYFDTQCVNPSIPGNCSRSFGEIVNSTGDKVHHIALINSIVVNSMQAMGGADCGDSSCQTPTGEFADYKSAVGNIVYNANQNGAYQGCCTVSAIDFTNLGNWDSIAGTHAFAYNNYAINNSCTSGTCATSDVEAFMADSPDVHSFAHTIVFANNLAYLSTRSCLQITGGGYNPTVALVQKYYNNTCYNNQTQGVGYSGGVGELDTSGNGSTTSGWTLIVYNNINYAPNGTVGSALTYAAVVGGSQWGSWQEGTTVCATCQNVMYGAEGSCNGTCPQSTAPFIESYFNSNPVATLTTNYFVNPSFANTADLLANHTGAPNCTGFDNTTACLGWDASTKKLTALSVISDLQAGCANCGGKGFQLPSIECAANADYPVWLKGINYLHALDGFVANSRIQEKSGLATKPCNM